VVGYWSHVNMIIFFLAKNGLLVITVLHIFFFYIFFRHNTF